jgi:ketosteroid isomerase-like protein
MEASVLGRPAFTPTSQKNIHMKLITSLPSLIALLFVSSVLAQEESPSPMTEEETSTTIEETPAPTAPPTPETKTSASPATTAEQSPAATATKKEQPTTEKKTSPTAAVSPSAVPASKKMSPQAALKESENRWAAAIAKHDVATIELMVAPDFIGVNQKGKVQNRRAMLGEMKADKDTYTSAKNEKLDVKMYGSGVGVVVGTYREKGTGKDGKAFDHTMRFTDTWMDRGGQWQCIASHVMTVSQK